MAATAQREARARVAAKKEASGGSNLLGREQVMRSLRAASRSFPGNLAERSRQPVG